jgi:hypothetical protein
MRVSDVTDTAISYCLFSLAIISAILCVAGAVTMICILLQYVAELFTTM